MSTESLNSNRKAKSKYLIAGSSSSQPDLSKFYKTDSESKNIVLRKRKYSDDFSHDFAIFKQEIKDILKESANIQNENLKAIKQDIASIKEQFEDIKVKTDLLITENNSFKLQIANLTSDITENKQQIKCVQNDIEILQKNSSISDSTYNAIMTEIQDRTERAKNIIIVGLTEENLKDIEKRKETDNSKVIKIISEIYPLCPNPEKIMRLGKYDGKINRPLKVTYRSQDVVKNILKNKSNLKDKTIRFYSDQTPKQREIMINLKNELQKRTENGEQNLTIKYIKGIPKITTYQPKN